LKSENLSFVNIDLNSCWIDNDKSSDAHNQIFIALKSCTEAPHITIENET